MRFITLSLIAWLFATALIAQTSQVTSQPMPNADSLIADVLSPLDLDQVPSGWFLSVIDDSQFSRRVSTTALGKPASCWRSTDKRSPIPTTLFDS